MEQFDISKLLNGQGQLTALPKKQCSRQAALSWLTKGFSHGRFYSEKEVTTQLGDSCCFTDGAMLRRELCDSGRMSRTNNGSRYWRSDFLRGGIDCGGALLRDITDSDADALMEIHQLLRYYDNLAGEPFTAENAQALIRKTDLPADGSPEFYIAKMILAPDRQPVGYIMLYEGYPQPDTLWVGSLFIHADAQHKGFGGKIMKTVETQAGQSGFTRAGLGVYAQNSAGLQFWVGQSYRSIDRVRTDEHTKVILSLSKRLSGIDP